METTAALQQQTEAAVTAVEGEQWPSDDEGLGKRKEAAAPKSVAPPKKTEVKPPPKPEPKEADNDEAEWPDLPDSSDTKYGIPDYGDGFEGDDAAGIDAPGDDEGDALSDDEQRQQTELNIYYLVAGQSLFGAQSMS